MACDMCGKSEPFLQQLNPQYQTDKIKDICSECAKRVNDHLWTLRQLTNKMNESTLKQFMENWKRKCEWCGKEFPKRKGRFCGTCQPPKTTVSINKDVLFQLMHSHSRLAQAEYERNPAYNNGHFSAVAEHAITDHLNTEIINQYFDYVDKQEI